MPFNYVLTSETDDFGLDIINMTSTKKEAYEYINSLINSYGSTHSDYQLANRLLMINVMFNGRSPFRLISKCKNGALLREPIRWEELSICGMNGQKYIDCKKAEFDKKRRGARS